MDYSEVVTALTHAEKHIKFKPSSRLGIRCRDQSRRTRHITD